MSLKLTHIDEGNAYWEVTSFIKIPYIFSSLFPLTSREVVAIVSTSDLSFVQNLLEGDKVEMDFELTYIMFKFASIFSLVSTRQGNVWAWVSLFNKRVPRKINSRLYINL